MSGRLTDFIFGGGSAPVQHWALLLSFLALLGVSWYSANGPTGPGAGPMLVYLVFALAFVVLLFLTPLNATRWAAATGRPRWLNLFIVPGGIILVWYLWTFVVWGTDPNYPERLPRGRILLPLHALLVYVVNLYFLWRVRAP